MTKSTKVTEAPEAEVAEPTITATMLAERCNTTPKEFRRWLRTVTTNRAGRGGRWVFSTEVADALVAAFNARAAAKATVPELKADAPANA